MNITSARPQRDLPRQGARGFDAIIPRIGASHTFYGRAVVRQFEMMGVLPPTSRRRSPAAATSSAACNCWPRNGIGAAGDRVRPLDEGHRRPARHRRRRTGGGEAARGHAGHRRGARRDEEGGRVGHRGVPRARREHPRAGVHQGSEGLRHPGDRGRHRVVAAIKRTGAPGDFRSNLHRGGTAERIRLTPEERPSPCAPRRPWA